ncbi:MAG TPA: hypothetical protein VJ998_09595 [Pseudomonadales bacterium]|nr:hypothetical protein [Pseudomonadales bacterium]
MRIPVRAIATVAALLAILTAGIYTNEAEKEVRILCSLFKPGITLDEVERILATANLLHVQAARSNGHHHLEVTSWYNLKLTSCTVLIEDGFVKSSSYRPAPWSR